MGKLFWTGGNDGTLAKAFLSLEDSAFYEVLDNYTITRIGTNSYFKIQCLTCGNVWNVNITKFFKRGDRCSDCKRGLPWTEEKVVRLHSSLPDKEKYTILECISAYNNHFSVKMRCNVCNTEWVVRASNFYNTGHRCLTCKKGKRWTADRVAEEFKLTIDSSDFQLIKFDDVTKNTSGFTVKCNKCGTIWETNATRYFHAKSRCPICRNSKGEKHISEILNRLGIAFIAEKRFNSCRNIKTLPFDFFLPDHNILIEFQGLQHFITTTGFNAKRNMLIESQKRDKIKSEWTKRNGYRFLEIHYDEFIWSEQILLAFLLN